MKARRILLVSLLSTFILFITVRCSDDDPAPLATLSGTVMYPGINGSTPAGGAVVLLATTADALEYDYYTVADASGNYSFKNLEAGTYYMNANFATNNTNSTGARLEGVNFNAGDDVAVTVGATDLSQGLTLVSAGQTLSNTFAVNYDGREGGAGNTGDWDFDGTHTTVDFAFEYKDNNAEFTGSFGRVTKMVLNLDASNLGSASLEAEVDLLSVNTRTRGGRDPKWDGEYGALTESTIIEETNCIATTFGIFADADVPSVVTDPQRYAKFVSTSIEAYGDGFIAKGNLTFSADMVESPGSPYGITNNPNTAVTKPAQIIFKHREGTEDATRTYVSFEGKMEIKAKADFNIFTSNVGDQTVAIYINAQMRKNK